MGSARGILWPELRSAMACASYGVSDENMNGRAKFLLSYYCVHPNCKQCGQDVRAPG